MVKESLHVKYRPKTWDDVIGNKKTVNELKKVLKRGGQRTYLLSGPSGCGKTTLARLIAKEVKCPWAAFAELNAADDRGIEAMRKIIRECEYDPWLPNKDYPDDPCCRVWLLDEAHQITSDASHALLKLLEEPPAHDYFILATTEPEKLLTTLRGRCMEFKVSLLSPSEIKGLLLKVVAEEKIEVTEDVLQGIVSKAEGSPRRALIELGQIRDLEVGEEITTPISDETAIEPPQAPLHGDLLYPTFHLKNFDYLDKGTGLYGKGYKLLVKAIWYILNGQVIKTKIVKLGGVETDCRMNFAFILKSGRGKKDIVNAITNVCNGLGEKVVKPTSYHPESLVGKVVFKSKIGYIQTKGHLADDIVILDDARGLMGQGWFNRESRKYIGEALNQIGQNEITKRPTGIPREEALRYYPNCSIQILFQPFDISGEVAESGFFRRFLFLLPEIELSKEIFSQKTRKNGTSKSQSLSEVLDHLKELRNVEHFDAVEWKPISELTFSEEAVSRFNDLHLLLVEYGEGYSKKVSRYIEMIGFPLQNLFLKMIAILANSEKRTEVLIRDVEMAFVDLIEFLDSNFEYVEQKVQGSLDYDDKNQPTGQDLKMLEWLKEKGALSHDASEISINAYQDEIVKTFQVSPYAARNWYKKHVERGWIKGKQKGAHDSRVWLTFKLDEDEGDKGGRVVAEYKKIIACYAKEKDILLLTSREPLKLPWFPSLVKERVSPYHPAHLVSPFKMLGRKDVEEREEEGEQWKWETLLEGFDCKQYLMKVHDRKKRLVFNFLFADTMSRWTIERIWKKGVPTGYELDLAFLKDGERKPKIKKWIMDFHARKADELVRILKDWKY